MALKLHHVFVYYRWTSKGYAYYIFLSILLNIRYAKSIETINL